MENERRTHDVMRLLFVVAILLFCFVISAQAADIGEIHSGETKTGNIATAGQTDSYTFYGEENQTIVIEMAASGSDLGPAMYLYSPNGTLETKVVFVVVIYPGCYLIRARLGWWRYCIRADR